MSEAARDRLLVVASEFTYGGNAFLLVRHLRRLLARYDVDLVITGPAEARMLREVPAVVTVRRLRLRRRRWLARLWLAKDPLAGFLLTPMQVFRGRSYRAALMSAGILDWRACMLFGLARAPRKLLFVTDGGLRSHRFYRKRERAAIECMVLAADRVLPVSRRLRQEVANAFPLLAQRPWEVMRPPLAEPAAGAAISPYGAADTPTVLTIARLMPEKGLDRCVRAHARLKRAGVRLRWFVIGTGDEEATLRAEIGRSGLTDDFRLVGHQPDIDPWLAHCDVFALFSREEGCPTVVLEALRAARPVIVTDVHGVDEIIDDGRTGLIVAQDDDAIAAGLSRLLGDAALRASLSRNLSMDAPISSAARDTDRLVALIEVPVAAPAAPRVSILIPTYNQAAFIDRAVASALMQDYGDLEVVVVDDASTDDTARHLAAWAGDPRLRCERNPHNLGRIANYRRALGELARGDWVLMLDGDDYLLDPTFIRRALAAIARHEPGRVVLAQAGHRIQPDGSNAPPGPDLRPRIEGESLLMAGADYLRFVYDTGFFTHLGTLYDRRAAQRVGFYTEEISSSDMDSLLRLALEGDVLVLNTVAGCWVQHAANASANLPLAKIPENVRIFRRIADDAVARGLVTPAGIEGPLTRYEAVVLAYLCSQSLAGRPPRLRSLVRMIAVIFAVNPRLLFQPPTARACYDQVCRILGVAPKNRLARLVRGWFGRRRPGGAA